MEEPPAKKRCAAFTDKECQAMIEQIGASVDPLFTRLSSNRSLVDKKEKWQGVVEAVNEVSKVKRSRRDVWLEFVRLWKEVHRKGILVRREEKELEMAEDNGYEYDTSHMLKFTKVEKFECLMNWAVTEGLGCWFNRGDCCHTPVFTTTVSGGF
ncbi:hypothetical protein O3P69_004764 [Scylla paramamosain]|uniref:Regulatory protein zeste n=1 Tax=Scylla paramamosain TaxID=85552 RepID=A0AAW0UAZ9_SCYPA